MSKCCNECVPKRGDRGLRGPQGIQGEQGEQGPQGPSGPSGFPNQAVVVGIDDIVVTNNTVGLVTTYTVGRPKEFFYDEVVSTVNVDNGTWTYYFPLGYTGLTYTNGTLVAKTYLVQVSYDAAPALGTNIAAHGNWVEGAIIKTVLGVDTTQWESDGHMIISSNLYNGPLAGDVVDAGTTDYVVDNLENHVEVRFTSIIIPSNTAFFKYLTLNPGESVSLQFKAKNGNSGFLKKAQLVVQEL
jgi:hypothetical protein